MKKQKRKVIFLVILILVLIILLTQISQKRKEPNTIFQDELIFFKWFSLKKEKKSDTYFSKNQVYPEYQFKVSYKDIDFKNIDLSDTIRQDTLVHEKIAPRNRRSI